MIPHGVRADNTGAALSVGNASRKRNVPMTKITVHKLPLPDRKEQRFLRPNHAGLGIAPNLIRFIRRPRNAGGANEPTSARLDEPTPDAATKP